jgi:hypothetical protein
MDGEGEFHGVWRTCRLDREGPLLLEHRDFRVLIIGFDTPQINAIGEKKNSLTRSSRIQTIFVRELRKQCNNLKYIEYDSLHFI